MDKKVINTIDFVFNRKFFTRPIGNMKTLPQHSPEDLFNFSCEAIQRVFLSALKFWNDKNTTSSADFFANSEHIPNYIGLGSWNLDTGLPCEYNNYSEMRCEKLARHYAFKTDELKDIYDALKSQYDPTHFPSLD